MKILSYRSRSFFSLLSLTVALAIVSVAGAADVSFYGVIKGQNYIQNNPATPSLSDNDHSNDGDNGRFFFNAWAELTATNSVTNATVQVPISGTVKPLQLTESGEGQEFRETFEAPLFLDGNYPNGTYRLTLSTKNDSIKTIDLALSGTYASIPVINNFTALQAVTPASSYTVSWSISGGLATDYVQLEIKEENPFGEDIKIYQSPQPGQSGALNGTATSTNITSGPLSAGKVYKGRIMVARGTFASNNAGYNGVSGVVGYVRRTEFPIVASGVPTGDTQAPQLNTSTPYNGDSNVPTNAVVGFTFNERMKTNVSVASSIQWSGGGINAANFSYAWSPDSKTLYCVYNTSLPSGATIQWTLNPTNTLQNLRDLADNKFSTDYQGQFMASTGSASVTDVKRIFVFKGQGATQTNATSPVALGLFFAGMGAELAAYNTVTNGSLTVPTATPSVLTPQREDYPYGDSFEIEAKYDSKANLDLFFPNGSYTVSLKTAHDGNKTFTRTLTPDSYPNLPNISNFTAAQTVNSAASFAVNWTTFTGGSSSDFIQLQIENDNGNTIFETAHPGEVGALTGTATSTTIPVGKLYPGRTYEARLQFIKVMQTDTTTYLGVTFRTAYFTETQFKLVTTGTPIQPQLSLQPFNAGQFSLRLTGEPQRSYTIQGSDTLTSGSWFDISGGSQNADDGGHIDFTDFNSFGRSYRFYRGREGNSNSGN